MSTAKSSRIFAAITGIAVIVLALGRFALTKLAPEAYEPSPATETLAVSTRPAKPRATKTATLSGGRVKIHWLVENYSVLALGNGYASTRLMAMEKVIADFNASQDEIELIVEVRGDLHIGILSGMIRDGTVPDIVGPIDWRESNYYYDQWLDLAPYIESTGFDTSLYDPALIEFYQTDEGQVGLPFEVSPAAIYYVPAMFDRAGLAYPPKSYGSKYSLDGKEVDWNWDTLAKVAKRLTLDANSRNATEEGFDATRIVQVGFVSQWQTNLAYQASYIAGAADIVEGDAPGSYKSSIPDCWKEASKWLYDGMWGEQPFIITGPLTEEPEFGYSNPFDSGRTAMTLTPLWLTCCLERFRDAGLKFDAGIIPLGADGQAHGRIDGETFHIWKGTKHPEEAFKALAYLIGPEGTQTLFIGSDDLAPGSTLNGLPAIPAYQQPYIDGLLEKYPFTTAETWDVFLAGLSYPDHPSADQWQPNWPESWSREQDFFDLLQNTPPDQLDFDAEWQKMVDDLNEIYNK